MLTERIIKYLDMLPPESEDAILTSVMHSGGFGFGEKVGCLITVAECEVHKGKYALPSQSTGNKGKLRDSRRLELDAGGDYTIGGDGCVAGEYDRLCRYGNNERVNAAIRQHILDNKLKRRYAENNVTSSEKENLSLNEEALQTTEG